MPPLSPAKPSTEPSRLNPGRVGPDILMCDINCTPIVWAFHSPAGSCLLQLFYYDSFVTIGLLCIFDMRLMANETIPEEKSHQGHRWIKGILPCTPTHWGLECFKKKKKKKRCLFSEFFFRPCNHRNSRCHVVIFLLPLSWKLESFCVSLCLDTAEIVIVERCLFQDYPIAHKHSECATSSWAWRGICSLLLGQLLCSSGRVCVCLSVCLCVFVSIRAHEKQKEMKEVVM